MSTLTVMRSVDTPYANNIGIKVDSYSDVTLAKQTDNVHSPKQRAAHLRVVDASYIEALSARKALVEPSSFSKTRDVFSSRRIRRPNLPVGREQHHSKDFHGHRDSVHGKRIVQIVGWIVALVLSVAIGLGIGTLAMPTYTGATETYTVQPGDTLWSLSQGIASDASVEQTVAEIATMNQLDETVLIPGQTLEIPVHPARLQK